MLHSIELVNLKHRQDTEMITLAEFDELEFQADNMHPDWPGLLRAAEIDAPIAERERPCKKCGNTRLYRQIVNSGSCRVFSVCLVCEDVVEF